MAVYQYKNSFIVRTKGDDGSNRKIDGTTAIAISFVFLAYFLHPAIEKAYNRVRAYRAWRAIEKREQVEVTTYSMTSEVFGARGIWDAARIITVLLAAFSLASWGLELQLGLANIENGPVCLPNAPPPVFLLSDKDNAPWVVLSPSEGLDREEGSLGNMHGNYAEGIARSRYHVANYIPEKVDGKITVASWWDNVDDRSQLFYNIKEIPTTVNLLNCSTGGFLSNRSIFEGENETPWGTVVECGVGPSLSNALLEKYPTKTTSPPTIMLTKTNATVSYIIVEESSTYPSFLYSVWKSDNNGTEGVEIHHVFHIASTMRLVEAVVTGIVHGLENGGGCFGLLRQYSEEHCLKNDTRDDRSRASPFGEKPEFGRVEYLDEVEAIEAGVEVSVFVLLCAVWLMVLTSIGFAWSLCLRRSIGMDIYNRDELIRAVSMPAATGSGADASNCENPPPPSSIRIFVRKEDAGHMSVAVSEAAEGRGLFERFFRRGSKVSAHDDPAPIAAATVNAYNAGYGGATVPVGPQTAWLEGKRIRTGRARAFPGPDGNFVYPTIALAASPVPSTAVSLAGTPAHTFSPVAPGNNPVLGRGPSVMFDTAYDSDISSGSMHEEDVEAGRDGVGGANGGRGCNVGNGSLVVANGENSPGPNSTLGTDVQIRGNNDAETTQIALSGTTTTPETTGGSSPVPSRGGLTTDYSLGPPQISRLIRAASEYIEPAGSEDEVKECCTDSSDDDLV